jgi:4-nitrophenyl phosphatase
MPSGDYSSINNDPSIGAVLCGGDHFISTSRRRDILIESISRGRSSPPPFLLLDRVADYKKYAKAHTYIMNNSGCKFLITNGDGFYPDSRGTLPGKSFLRRSLAAEPSVDHTTWHAVEPACGAISAPISLSTGRTPTIIGKPSHYMMDCILAACVDSSCRASDDSC